ncbi:MAG TPA: ATP-binding cassette domain-containing protein [Acidobacteriota bacterium]|nr:ATP-binding cassette domain-containing protein [Acidobacteriota bacterium]
MIRLDDVSVVFGDRDLFSGVSWQVQEDARIALIGVNGSGKSTLLRILSGEQEPDSGKVERAKNFSVGYLPQELHAVSHKVVFEEALSGGGTSQQIRMAWEQTSEALKHSDPQSDEYHELVLEFGRLQHLLEEMDAFSLEAKTSQVLAGLGIPESWWQRPMTQLSGGWQMRVQLARLILAAPSLLLLDEPTNHLDVESIVWLSEFLRTYEGGLVIISHDRYFLDENTRASVEIWNSKLHFYAGNYSYYEKEKQSRLQLLQNAYRNQQEEIARIKEFIDRFRYKATKARQVQSRIKMLEKMDRIEIPADTSTISLRIPEAPRSGRIVLEASKLGHHYEAQNVFTGIDLKIERSEKVALVGVNGAGKTTLLKILSGALDPAQGKFHYGHNVYPAYYAQTVTDQLDLRNTILEELTHHAPEQDETTLRTLLGSFLFSGDDVYKRISLLSGGEKSRVALAKILIQPSNLLLLDEPTNHLDLNSKQILLIALRQYTGAVLFISHDRYFMDQLAQKVFELRDGVLTTYLGNYSEYREKVEQSVIAEVPAQLPVVQEQVAFHKSKETRRKEAQTRQAQSRWKKEVLAPLAELEGHIAKSEERLRQLELVLADNQTYADQNRFQSTLQEFNALKQQLEKQYKDWELLQKRKQETEKT